MSISMQDENQAFNRIWLVLLQNNALQKQREKPHGYVLGGQPGAGKSQLISLIQIQNQGNVLVINGDEFRAYHPNFHAGTIQQNVESR